MNSITEEILMHYGVKRRSGRYPWGSGETPFQRSGDFLSRVEELERKGLSEKEIVEALGLDSTTQLRTSRTIAKNERRRLEVDRAKSLKSDGYSTTEIGRMMGVRESTIRSWLNEDSERRMNEAMITVDILKKEIANQKMIDVGAGVERELGISKEKMKEAVFIMEAEGYNRYGIGVPNQLNPGKQTIMDILCAPDISYKYAYDHMGDIGSVKDYHSKDGGMSYDKREYPASIDSNRVKVVYGDEGGADKDGVIELRRGVADLDLGKSHYAQVRILVDGTHYLKGMAMYSDDLPDGVDILFNTNKKSGTPKMDVFKEIQNDPDNPFGAYIKANGQSWYTDPVTGEKKLSAINKLKEEGDWDKSSKNLSSQFLSKQPLKLIKQQLDLTYSDKVDELETILSLQNPTLKKKFLLEFADSCDSAAVHLKAAALPRQETRVILPIKDLKETEVYAPYLNDGEEVVLIRYPHGGVFEIPKLKVNNKNQSAKSALGNATDAIGINSKVAEQLSGADFDGDTVVVIPLNNKVHIKTDKPLKDLVGFDAKDKYRVPEGNPNNVKLMTKGQVGREMGVISNLITDMTLGGADDSELARAVKHSMVVIDAYKHKLDYKQSEKDNGIAELKKAYQPKRDSNGNVIGYGGAQTLISKRKQTVEVPERKGSGYIDSETGKVVYKESGRTYIDNKGNRVEAKTKVPLVTSVDDVRSLSSGTLQENAYAHYANQVLSLANRARKEFKSTPNMKYDSGAKRVYQTEVDILKAKLDNAARNAPRERKAQAIANSVVKAKIQAYPELSEKENKKELMKIKKAAIEDARVAVGASSKENKISITDREWEAIQAGAISDSMASQIFRYCDLDELKERAMPRQRAQLSAAKESKISSMAASGYTIAQIAQAIGVSTSTVSKYLNS